MKSNIIYRPLTATPFNHSAAYKEIEPCRMLQSYVRCFWTGEYNDFEAEGNGYPEVVIPDTCVDIIYRVDDTDHTVTADFSGINDRSFMFAAVEKLSIKYRCLQSAFMHGAPMSFRRIPLKEP